MLMGYIILLMAAVPLVFVATQWRDEGGQVDRWFERFELPALRADFIRRRRD